MNRKNPKDSERIFSRMNKLFSSVVLAPKNPKDTESCFMTSALCHRWHPFWQLKNPKDTERRRGSLYRYSR